PGFDVVDGGIEAVPAVDDLPVLVSDTVLRQGAAGATPTTVVLKAAADVIGLFIVQALFVKLADGDGVQEIPSLAAVVAPVNAAVTAGDHVVGIGRVDPHGVKIAMNFLHAVGGE